MYWYECIGKIKICSHFYNQNLFNRHIYALQINLSYFNLFRLLLHFYRNYIENYILYIFFFHKLCVFYNNNIYFKNFGNFCKYLN